MIEFGERKRAGTRTWLGCKYFVQPAIPGGRIGRESQRPRIQVRKVCTCIDSGVDNGAGSAAKRLWLSGDQAGVSPLRLTVMDSTIPTPLLGWLLRRLETGKRTWPSHAATTWAGT